MTTPALGTMRYQVPLSPGFALTVHSVQGREKDPLILDVCISASSSRETCYVPLSRDQAWYLQTATISLRDFPRPCPAMHAGTIEKVTARGDLLGGGGAGDERN